jgi:hypothetical protein
MDVETRQEAFDEFPLEFAGFRVRLGLGVRERRRRDASGVELVRQARSKGPATADVGRRSLRPVDTPSRRGGSDVLLAELAAPAQGDHEFHRSTQARLVSALRLDDEHAVHRTRPRVAHSVAHSDPQNAEDLAAATANLTRLLALVDDPAVAADLVRERAALREELAAATGRVASVTRLARSRP